MSWWGTFACERQEEAKEIERKREIFSYAEDDTSLIFAAAEEGDSVRETDDGRYHRRCRMHKNTVRVYCTCQEA
jgi:hypothetical protein